MATARYNVGVAVQTVSKRAKGGVRGAGAELARSVLFDPPFC